MISKEQFEGAYRKFPPDKYESFYLKYISLHSLQRNKLPILIIFTGLIFPFIFASIGYILEWSKELTYIPSFIYAALLACIAIIQLIIWNKKNVRYKKIKKYLNISNKKYKDLINKYYHNKYVNVIDYIKSKYDDNENTEN